MIAKRMMSTMTTSQCHCDAIRKSCHQVRIVAGYGRGGNICHPDLRTQQPAISAGMPLQCPEKMLFPWRHCVITQFGRPAGDNRCSASEGRIPVALEDIRTGEVFTRVLSEAAPETPGKLRVQQTVNCPPSLISLGVFYSDVPFFSMRFPCRRPHLSVPFHG